jgi:hypothetical protein
MVVERRPADTREVRRAIMRKTLVQMTLAAVLSLAVTPSSPVEARDDALRAGANAAAQARAARNMRSDLNRRQIEMSRMQRLQANQAIRDRAASGIAGTPYVDSCSNQYRRWRQTRSKYWRNRFYACAN